MTIFENDYKEKHSLDDRKKESEMIIAKYPNRIPIIVQCGQSSGIEKLEKTKYLVPNDLSAGQFFYIIRKKNKLGEQDALFFYINNKLMTGTEVIGSIYEKEKEEDGYLYIYVAKEKVFG